MAEELNMQKATQVYDTAIRTFNNLNWNYEEHKEELVIQSGVKGEDLPIEFLLVVKPQQEVVQFLSRLPFNMPEDKRVDGAIAVCVANHGMIDGCFDYDLSDGEIVFKLTSSYRESTLGEELFQYMIMCSAAMVDRYNDQFFMLAKGMLTIQQFIEQENA